MTGIHSRCWIVRLFGFPYEAKWVVIVFVTSVSLSPPWVAGQTENLPPPPPGRYPFGSKVRVSPTMAVVLICLISTFFIIGCVSVYVRQCVERRMAQSFTLEADGVGASRRSRGKVALGLDPAVIDAFPTFLYSEVKGLKIGKGALECAVCLNEFEDDETLRLLPKCSHVFHPYCIDAWLSSHITCPVCRANLIPRPGETVPVTVLGSDTDCEAGPGHSVFSPDIHDHVSQNLNLDNLIPDIQSPDVLNAVETPNQNNPRRELVTEKFWRSYSTGHALVQPGENCDRFTLRLPEEVRNRLVNSSLSRTKSCMAFPRARSSRKGYRSSSGGTGRERNFYYERFDRWGFTMTPPFFSRAGSARSPKMAVGGGEESTAAPKTFLKSIKSPLHRLFGATESHREDINVGERSFDRLRMDDQV